MAHIKLLILLTAITMGLNSNKTRDYNYQNDTIFLYNNLDTVVLNKNEYLLETKKTGFDLTVLQESKLEKIKTIENPNAIFYINGEKKIAIGYWLPSAIPPPESEYLLPLIGEKRVRILNKNVLSFIENFRENLIPLGVAPRYLRGIWENPQLRKYPKR